MDENLELIHWV